MTAVKRPAARNQIIAGTNLLHTIAEACLVTIIAAMLYAHKKEETLHTKPTSSSEIQSLATKKFDSTHKTKLSDQLVST